MMTSEADWIEWQGGECPVAPYSTLEIVLRNGRQQPTCVPQYCRWTHDGGEDDILRYRAAIARATTPAGH